MLIIIVSGLLNVVQAQFQYDSAYISRAKSYPENLLVFTDRSLYGVNESILFSALLQSGSEPYQGLGSKVLYAELVNSAGKSLAKGKFRISEQRSSAYLSIPSNIFSGNYFLRCYTRWMRNFGAREFSYIPLRIVNPGSGDVESVSTEQSENSLDPSPKGLEIVSVSAASSVYQAGEIVDLEFSLMEGSFSHIHHGCVTVVPSGSIDTVAFIHEIGSNPDIQAPFQFSFLPERNGTAISGTVLEQSNLEPSPDTRLHFSILGDHPAYYVTHSDKKGRFLLNTPFRSGIQEMFVIPEFKPGTPVEVRIDNDFSSDALPFQPGSFSLNQEEYALASRLSLQIQLQGAFYEESVNDSAIAAGQHEYIPFYGKPEISVKIDDYINLPNMEEVIENLIPKTYVMHRSGSVFLKITSENPMISMYPPLVLIDHIPVFDMDVIMAIPPSKIDRIEVVPEVYVKGEVKYGGILSLTSRKGDLAGIKLPMGSYFFDYAAFQASLNPLRPKYTGPGKIPDTRNTLFWMDHLTLQKDESRKVSFQAASLPGSYLILFRGVSSDGNIVYGLNRFIVE